MSEYYRPNRKLNLYNPQLKEPFRLSRSKIDLFLNCPRCFYYDRRLGVGQPPGFPFSLNSAVDNLLKNEFDIYRAKGEAHPLMVSAGIKAVPFKHSDLDKWRDSLREGIKFHHSETNLLITGGVDDVWKTEKGELIIVDYKATAKRMKAIRIINSNKAINIGARHITISTVGVVPKIKELAAQGLQVELAISLHGYDNPSRNVLMPVNKKYPFDELIAACREYVRLTKRQITFEYILIKDVTCTPHAVASLKQAFKGIICKMNLIPYNPVSEFGHKTPSGKEMITFRNSLEAGGVHATIRTPRGKDVNAACGQLRHLANAIG